jgi:hypothetical protein
MMKLMLVVGTMVVAVGCAGSTEDSTASLTSAVSAASSSSSGSDNANDDHGDGHHRGPPPEAFAACEGKAAGDACTMTHEDVSIAGTCVSPPADAPADAKIACRPDHMPEGGPPPGGGNCEGKPEDRAPSGS